MTPSVEFLTAHSHGAALFFKSYTFPESEKKEKGQSLFPFLDDGMRETGRFLPALFGNREVDAHFFALVDALLRRAGEQLNAEGKVSTR